MEYNDDFLELDLNLIFRKIWKNKFLIIIAGLIFGAIAYSYTSYLKKPLYSSTTKMYSINRVDEDSKITFQDLMTGAGLVKDYQQIILSSDVLSSVIEKEDLNMTEEELAGKITIDSPEETRVIDITVTDYNPKEASRIANAVRENSIDVIKEITRVEDITVIEKAKVSKKPVNINKKKTVILAFLFGIFVAIGIVVVKEIVDDRITTQEDIERLKVTSLGIIPRTGKKSRKK